MEPKFTCVKQHNSLQCKKARINHMNKAKITINCWTKVNQKALLNPSFTLSLFHSIVEKWAASDQDQEWVYFRCSNSRIYNLIHGKVAPNKVNYPFFLFLLVRKIQYVRTCNWNGFVPDSPHYAKPPRPLLFQLDNRKAEDADLEIK